MKRFELFCRSLAAIAAVAALLRMLATPFGTLSSHIATVAWIQIPYVVFYLALWVTAAAGIRFGILVTGIVVSNASLIVYSGFFDVYFENYRLGLYLFFPIYAFIAALVVTPVVIGFHFAVLKVRGPAKIPIKGP